MPLVWLASTFAKSGVHLCHKWRIIKKNLKKNLKKNKIKRSELRSLAINPTLLFSG